MSSILGSITIDNIYCLVPHSGDKLMNSTTHWFSWLKSNDKAIMDILEMQNLIRATGALVELIATYDNVN